ncbi:hypothetical protein K2X96_02460 [Patescibacteria group bacterium]|nr:hypothetical protein [Patescibacteria group bacterium]
MVVMYDRENLRPGINTGPGRQEEAGGLLFSCYLPPDSLEVGKRWNEGFSTCRYQDYFENRASREVRDCELLGREERMVAGMSLQVARVRCLDGLGGSSIPRTGEATIVTSGALSGVALEMRQFMPPGRMPDGRHGPILQITASRVEIAPSR